MLRVLLLSMLVALGACDSGGERIQRSVGANDIEIDAPSPGARVASPLRASGEADNTWYYEAVFPAKLMARDGTLIAEAPAVAASDWTRRGDVPFNVEMAFTVEEETPATLVLEEDAPRADHPPRQVRIPVVLMPEPQ